MDTESKFCTCSRGYTPHVKNGPCRFCWGYEFKKPQKYKAINF